MGSVWTKECMMKWTKMVRLEDEDVERAINAVETVSTVRRSVILWLNRLTTTVRSVARDARIGRVLDTNFAFANLDLSRVLP